MSNHATSVISNFDAVLFDFDGVVLDTTELHYRLWRDFGVEHGHPPTQSELIATNGRPSRETILEWLGPNLSEQQVTALSHQREERLHTALMNEDVPTVLGVREYINQLLAHNIPLALVTSSTRENVYFALKRIMLIDAFKVIVTANDVQHGKPNPECYIKAAGMLNSDPSSCLVVEDSIAGLRSAQAAGAKRLALSTSLAQEQLIPERSDWICSDFNHLPLELRVDHIADTPPAQRA